MTREATCERARQIDLAAFRTDPSDAAFDDFRRHYPGCADCSRAVAEWSRLVAALRATGDGSAHPDEARLAAFQSQPERLDGSERESIAVHLRGCARCRSELAVLRGFDFAALGVGAATREAAEPETGPRAGVATRLAEWIFGVPQPAWAMALLLALALPAAVASWLLLSEGSEPEAAPIARVEPETETPIPRIESRHDDETPIARVEPGPEQAPATVARDPQPDVSVPTPAPATPAPEPATRVASEASPVPEPTAEETAPQPMQIAALLPSELPRYRPDATLVGGPLEALRATGTFRAAGRDLPRIRALGPAHLGATMQAAPTLYWDLDTASEVPVEITIVAEDAETPLLELRVDAPIAAGTHALRLAEHGVRLEADAPHLWFATLVPDASARERDVVSGAGIVYAPPDASLARELDKTRPARRAHALAAAGYWYDAFARVASWMASDPDAERPRAYRDALLAQVGLAESE